MEVEAPGGVVSVGEQGITGNSGLMEVPRCEAMMSIAPSTQSDGELRAVPSALVLKRELSDLLFTPHMFFISCPNSAIRVIKSEFCMTFIKLPQAGSRLSLAAHKCPTFQLLSRGPLSLALCPHFFAELCFPGDFGHRDKMGTQWQRG